MANANVIKLKNRQGQVVLPLTRSQLVQVSQITGVNLLNEKSWTSASVQDALEAIVAYAYTQAHTQDNDLKSVKDALNDLIDGLNSVKNYIDTEDSAYLALAYAEADEKAAAAQANSYAEAAAKATEAKDLAYAEAAAQAAAAQANSYAEAAAKATEAQANSYAYTDEKATEAKDLAYAKIASTVADLTSEHTIESGKVISYIAETGGVVTTVNTTYLQSGDIKRTASAEASDPAWKKTSDVEGALEALASAIDAGGTGSVVTMTETSGEGANSYLKRYTITQGTTTVGTIDIPRDLLATQGELVYGSLSDNTFTPAEGGDAYIKMTVGNGVDTQAFYVPVQDLIEYNQFSESDEIGFTDTNHNVTAYVRTISDLTKITNGEGGTSLGTYLNQIESDLSSYNTRIGTAESTLSSYNTRIEALETTAAGLSYTVTDDSSYISVTPSTTDGATTFTISTSDIASATNLDALQTSYNTMNTELNSGVFYETVSGITVDELTLA